MRPMRAVRVMVVDDHRMVADGLATVLGADPALEVVACAASGAEAMALAGSCPIDAVVVDLRLPDVGGVDLVRRLRGLLPGLPAALISASFTRDALNDAIAAGINTFASKLASGDELVQVVRAAVAGKAYVSSDVVPLLTDAAWRDAPSPLTEREREVIQALADGRDVPDIADRLHLSPHTVRNHIRRSMQKLGVRRQLDAVVAASRLGYIEIGA
jgi:two-component system, NarL family, response regulator DesR